MNALVIGYGRAGRRHGRLLTKADIKWDYYDPIFDGLDNSVTLKYKLEKQHGFDMARNLDLDIAIISSPPHLHLEQIRQCLDAGLFVMVEKPLAAFGQLDEARELLKHPNIHKAMPALNYRWHPILAQFLSPDGKGGGCTKWEFFSYHPVLAQFLLPDGKGGGCTKWEFYSYQYRPALPEWGLPLDHLPHTLDMLLAMAGESPVEIRKVEVGDNGKKQWVYVYGQAGQPFEIIDQVTNEPVEKVAYIKGPWGKVDVDTSPEVASKMFDWMYADFLATVRGELDEFPVGMAQAVKVQELLERVYDKL